MDYNTLALIIIFLLTLNLLFVGFYIILVLKEIRETFSKFNRVLDSVEEVTDSLVNPLHNVSDLIAGINKGVQFVRKLRGEKSEE